MSSYVEIHSKIGKREQLDISKIRQQVIQRNIQLEKGLTKIHKELGKALKEIHKAFHESSKTILELLLYIEVSANPAERDGNVKNLLR